MSVTTLSRREFLKIAGATAAGTAVAAGASGTAGVASLLAAPSAASAQTIFPFPLSQVTLQTSTAPFTGNRDRTYSYLLFLDNDRMLYNFRVTAGLSSLPNSSRMRLSTCSTEPIWV